MKKQTLSTKQKLSHSRQPFKRKAISPAAVIAELKQQVRRYGIRWDIWPLYHIDREGRTIQIGFEFSLVGAHYHAEGMIEPGCPQCLKIFKDLQRIAKWIAPGEPDDGYDVVVADAFPYYSAQERVKPDIVQIVTVIHREGFDNGADARDVACLMEMKGEAETLGIISNGIRTA